VQENGVWRKRYNHELYALFNEPDTVKYTSGNQKVKAIYFLLENISDTDIIMTSFFNIVSLLIHTLVTTFNKLVTH
jgi:hypothetical protein